MPHKEPIYGIQLPVGINLQYLLALIPALGFLVTVFTCLKNVRHVKRSAAFSWWIQSVLSIFLSCLLLALLIWLCAIYFTGVLFVVLVVVATYTCIVGMAFAMINVEKKVIVKEFSKAIQEKLSEEQEVK